MARYVQRVCPEHSSDGTVSCQIIEMGSGFYTLQCGKCGFVFQDKAPSDRHLGQFKYPKYCASTGQYFRNRSEEKSYVKKHSLEVADSRRTSTKTTIKSFVK